jgi:hypothetical protein
MKMPDPEGEIRDEGVPGDWTRRAGEALVDGSAFEAIREHLAEGGTECVEWCPICRTADLLRANATPELREQWESVQREALLTIRTLIDHYLERLPSEPAERGPRVEDIPIE